MTDEFKAEAERRAKEDIDSIEPGDSPTEVESKVLGIEDFTGSPDEESEDAEAAPGPESD